ncbi:MAG: hypothetical protein AB8G86_21930 [Saprospiraceae bacterium]
MKHFINLKNKFFFLLSFSISLLIMGCAKESNENLVIDNLFIDEALAPYFERFVTEGANRGQTIDLVTKQIEGFLIDIEEANVAGQCSYSATSTRKVNIDRTYWNSATDLEKEFVIFHELGHCYLERSHSDIQENRNCTSIMHSGISGCRFNYSASSRSTYLDELF